MELEIHLQPEWRDRLLTTVPKKSVMHAALENAIELIGGRDMPDEFVVTCDESELPMLRRAAEQCCPRAVEFIDFAAHRSRLYRSGSA
jgi:hypothetical protein